MAGAVEAAIRHPFALAKASSAATASRLGRSAAELRLGDFGRVDQAGVFTHLALFNRNV